MEDEDLFILAPDRCRQDLDRFRRDKDGSLLAKDRSLEEKVGFLKDHDLSLSAKGRFLLAKDLFVSAKDRSHQDEDRFSSANPASGGVDLHFKIAGGPMSGRDDGIAYRSGEIFVGGLLSGGIEVYDAATGTDLGGVVHAGGAPFTASEVGPMVFPRSPRPGS